MNAIRWVESAMTASRTLSACSAPSLGGPAKGGRGFVSGVLGAAFLAAALAFPAGEAWARDECGALSSGSAACSDMAYASGIRYDVAGGWVNGVAGDVALTVTGGTATTITTPTTTGWASGIVVRTAEQGSSDSTTRTITLTVGENAAVAIAQSTNTISDGFDNTGVAIHQRGNAADATTVTLGSGVTIGGSTTATAMKRSGVHVLVENGTNTATHSIESAATIHSTEFGLLMDNRGSGNVEVTNSGSITTTTMDGSPSNKSGIRILDWSHSPPSSFGGDSRTADTTTTVTNSGSVTVSAPQARGIEVNAEGLGLYKIVNSGSGEQGITASGAGGHGVYVNALWHTGAADSTAVEIENSGRITTSGANGFGIYVETAGATGLTAEQHKGNVEITNRGSIASRNHAILVNANMGAISITHSGGTVSSSHADGIRLQQTGAAVTVSSSGDVTAENHGVFVSNVAGAGTVSITHSAGTITAETGSGIRVAIGGTGGTRITTTGGRIEAGADGLHAGIAASNPSGVTIANGAAVNAEGYGIVVWYGGEGETRIENSGAITAGNVGIHADDGGAGAITIVNSARVTGDNYGIFARNTQGRGAVTVTHSAGEIHGKAESGIAAWIGRWQREDDADSPAPISTATVRVEVTGGSVKASETHNKVAIAALNHEGGSAEVSVSKGATLSAKHNAGIYAQLADRQNRAGQIKVTQGGAITARNGVYASVSHASAVTIAAGVTTRERRDAMRQPLIDVTWTGTFTETERTLTTTLNGVAHAIESAQEAQAGEVEVIRGAAHTAGIDAEVLSWRVLNRIATRGDDPGAFADAAAQTALFAADADAATKARAASIVARFREVLATGTPAPTIIPGAGDVDTNKDGSYTDAEIERYLMEDSDARRTLLRDVLARGLSAAEKAVLQALVTDGGDLDAALDGVTGATDAWKDEVRALLDNYNTGNIRVAMNGGSIDSGGDGIRAWYARQHDRNGAISVTVAEGASVTGGAAGVYVANAGAGLRIAKKYLTPDQAAQDENENLKPDDLVTLADYLNQVVRVDGTVTGGEDAAVHLAGGGALIVGRTGRLVAGSSGRTILVNDPGPAIIWIEGQVRGGAGREAAVDLTGGGGLTVGATGRVEANGATSAIRSNDPETTVVIAGQVKGSEEGEAAVDLTEGGELTVGATGRVEANGASSAIRSNDPETTVVIAGQVKGSKEGEAAVHLAGGGELTVGATGRVEANGASSAIRSNDPETTVTSAIRSNDPETTVVIAGQVKGSEGGEAAVHLAGGGTVTMNGGSIDSGGDGIRAWYARQHDRNGAISVTVAEGASVTGGAAGVYVANAGAGLRIAKKYLTPADQESRTKLEPDDLVTLADYLNQVVRVDGTVTGGRDAAVHLDGGGALIVGRTGRLVAGSSGRTILVNDPGPAIIWIEGQVRGGAGREAAVDLTGGGGLTVGATGRVEANGASSAIRSNDPETTVVIAGQVKGSEGGEAAVHLAGGGTVIIRAPTEPGAAPRVDANGATRAIRGGGAGRMATVNIETAGSVRYREDAAEIASGAVVGSYAGVSTVTLVQVDESGETGHKHKLPLTTDGNVDGENIDLPPRPQSDFECEGQRRCELYEALPSVLLAMNGMLSYAERSSVARDANGGWARVEGARGKWEAKKAKTTGKLSYDHRRGGVRAGVDFGAGEQGRVGVSVHLLNGKAERSGVGDVEVDGMGAGASATWRTGDLYVDVQAGATWYEVGVDSADPKRRPLVKEADGLGYAMGVEAGQRMAMGEDLVVTPRVALVWSKVKVDDFTDTVGDDGARVSVEDAHSARGRLGVLVEMEAGMGERSGRLFGSLDVEQEFSDETQVNVGATSLTENVLKTEVRPTTLRLGVGGVLGLGEDMMLRGTAGYETSGSGTSGYGGGLELNLRF